MDAFSAALSSVHVKAAIFVDAEFSAPWGFISPPADEIAPIVAPGVERLVTYHLVVDGQAQVRLQGSPDLAVSGGEIVIVPHGDAHAVLNGEPTTFVNSADAIGNFWSGQVATARFGGGGAVTRIVCGFFGCERHAARLFLAGLPSLMKVPLRGDAGGAWIETSILHLCQEAAARRPGGTVLLSKMAEALFIESLRRYMEQLPPGETGWLAGARDPVVGAALALMRRRPSRRWTLADLATEAGASRSVLVERFQQFLGEPPLTWLAHWRMQLAAKRLQTTRDTVLQIAADVGYESEAAFNRAFKREFELPPAQYRNRLSGKDNVAIRKQRHRGSSPDNARPAKEFRPV
jgi:AraC-like DNA-binding protein